jgi:DNA polymerase III epsilon subunit-like protein
MKPPPKKFDPIKMKSNYDSLTKMRKCVYEPIRKISIRDLLGQRVLIFDTETTDLPKLPGGWDHYYDYHENGAYDPSRIVSIAWTHSLNFNLKQIPKINSYLRKPVDFNASVFNPAAVKKNGISYQLAVEKGVVFEEILSNLLPDLQQSDYVIACNVLFDANILWNELCRMEQPIPSVNFVNIQEETPARRSMSLDQWYSNLLGQPVSPIHTSEGDVNKLFYCMCETNRTQKRWGVYTIDHIEPVTQRSSTTLPLKPTPAQMIVGTKQDHNDTTSHVPKTP